MFETDRIERKLNSMRKLQTRILMCFRPFSTVLINTIRMHFRFDPQCGRGLKLAPLYVLLRDISLHMASLSPNLWSIEYYIIPAIIVVDWWMERDSPAWTRNDTKCLSKDIEHKLGRGHWVVKYGGLSYILYWLRMRGSLTQDWFKYRCKTNQGIAWGIYSHLP